MSVKQNKPSQAIPVTSMRMSEFTYIPTKRLSRHFLFRWVSFRIFPGGDIVNDKKFHLFLANLSVWAAW